MSLPSYRFQGSERDLVGEIARGVHALGARFIAYLPGEVAGAPRVMQKAFRWTSTLETNQAEFQKTYLDVITEWSESWGALADGWRIDGCFEWPVFRNTFYDWPAWYKALRAGNSNSALAFNDGSFCIEKEHPVRPEHDFLSGEAEELIDGKIQLGRNLTEPHPRLHRPPVGRAAGDHCRWHALLPVDAFWWHGGKVPDWIRPGLYAPPGELAADQMPPPIYSDESLKILLHQASEAFGGVTFNAGIFQQGRLGRATIAQLKRLQTADKSTRVDR